MRKGTILVGLLMATQASATGISPYLPFNTSPVIEKHVENLIALTSGTSLTKPYKAADIHQRLVQIKQSHPRLYQQLSHYLGRYKKRSGVTLASVELSDSDSEVSSPLTNQFGQTTTDKATFKLHGFHFFTPYVYVSQGATQVITSEDKVDTQQVNTHLGMGVDYLQLDVGYRPHWLSPMQYSNGILTTHASPSPSVTLSNSAPISPLNIRYELFQQRLNKTNGIAGQGNEVFKSPRLSGLHIGLSPLDSLSLGFNQILQYAGDGYDYGFDDHLTSIFAPQQLEAPNGTSVGYHMTSISGRWNQQQFINTSLYGEVYRNETQGAVNASEATGHSYGIHLPALMDFGLTLTVEHTSLSGEWYGNPIVQNGYQDSGLNLGHYGWNASLQEMEHWVINTTAPIWNSHYLDITAKTTDYSGTDATTSTPFNNNVAELNIGYSIATKKGLWTLRFIAGDNANESEYQRISLSYEW